MSQLEFEKIRTRDRIDLLETYAFVFRSPDWASNLAMGMVAFLVATIIQLAGLFAMIVFWGYQISMMESLIRAPGYQYPSFTFNRFGEYLHRGIFPFLLTLPVWLFWAFQSTIAYFGFVFSLIGFVESEETEYLAAFTAFAIPTVFLLIFFAWILVGVVMVPLGLRVGLTRSFGQALKLRWLWGFIQKTWVELFIGVTFLFVTSQVLSILGSLLFCIGVFLIQGWAALAYGHFSYQIYALYLHRGGEAIDFYVPPAPAPAPGPMPPILDNETIYDPAEESTSEDQPE